MSADSAVVKLVKARIAELEKSLVGYTDWQNELNDSQTTIDNERDKVAAELNELKLFMEAENL